MVHYEETNQAGDNIETYYPSKLLGFIETNGTHEAVIQCSVNPLSWDDIQQNFVMYFQLGQNFDVSLNINRYFVVLPKRNWSHFFGNQINE